MTSLYDQQMPPPLVPTFYEMKFYEPHWYATVPRLVNWDRLHFTEKSAPYFQKMLHYFNLSTFERCGVLHGEYVLYKGLIMIGADGMVIKAGMAWEDKWGGNLFCDHYCNSEAFSSLKRSVLSGWNEIPIGAESPIILSHPHSDAYYHWTLETVTKNRFFKEYPDNLLIVQDSDIRHLFQKDLLYRTLQGHQMLLQEQPFIKVRNPILSHEIMSENSIRWLRDTVQIFAKPAGDRRIYLRRSPGGKRDRSGGGIHETPEFIAFLKQYHFESIDFSDRQMTVEEQVSLLDNAAVILAPHGAALTNLVYMNAPLKVIEVLGPRTPRALFMHIASNLNLDYYGIFSHNVSEDEDIILDMDELHDVMQTICR